MSDSGQTEIPKGSYAAGRRMKMPAGAQPPFVVFINGVEQSEGADYEVRAGEIVFKREIVKETDDKLKAFFGDFVKKFA